MLVILWSTQVIALVGLIKRREGYKRDLVDAGSRCQASKHGGLKTYLIYGVM